MVQLALATLKRLATGRTPAALLVVLLLAGLYLMSDATHSSTAFGQLYSWLLVINIAAALLLIGLIGKHLYRLVRQMKSRSPGTRLTSRLVVMFIVLAVTPVTVVYYFSLDFIQRGIDSWFDVRVEQALDDALELGRASLDMRMREVLHQTQQVSTELSDTTDALAPFALNDLRAKLDASELTLFSSSGHIIASSAAETAGIIPTLTDERTLLQLRQGKDYVGLDPIRDTGLHVRVAVLISDRLPVGDARILQALYPISERMNTLANSVQSAFAQYKELAYLRKPLKYSFILTLSLVLLLSMLTSVWAAFFSARRLMAPITDLVEGTQAVAAGDYRTRLPLSTNDELGFLVRSFNEMTHKIALAQSEVQRSQQHAEEQRAYLEVVLRHLSSGVLSLGHDLTLHTCNQAAGQILGIDVSTYLNRPLTELATEHGHSQHLVDVIGEHLQRGDSEWREELVLFGSAGRQVLMCRGTQLPELGEEAGGVVVVFDDVTALVQAQRDAAWGEVARRLAHEIKNPLTPIQLSAERLRRKYLATMSPKDADVLDRSTHTIVQQVESLKEMVKAFSEYARMPQINVDTVDLNHLVEEVLDLYRLERSDARLSADLDPKMPELQADSGRLRQLLHNLIKNALEATDNVADARISVSTRCLQEAACRFVELRVCDTGGGISDELLANLFEPYVTSKRKGTGLGLAIVKKIVEEHGGMVRAENIPGGAAVTIRLPVREAKGQRVSRETTSQQITRDKDDAAA